MRAPSFLAASCRTLLGSRPDIDCKTTMYLAGYESTSVLEVNSIEESAGLKLGFLGNASS